MMFASVNLLVSLGLSYSFRIAENVVFERTQEISLVRSRWTFSFFIDLKTYRRHMETLQKNLVTTETNIGRIMAGRRGKRNLHYLPMFQGQRREVRSLKEFLGAAQQELKDILDIRQSQTRRVKRALLPIGGKALGFLFGTATKKELRKVYKHIDILANNQE